MGNRDPDTDSLTLTALDGAQLAAVKLAMEETGLCTTLLPPLGQPPTEIVSGKVWTFYVTTRSGDMAKLTEQVPLTGLLVVDGTVSPDAIRLIGATTETTLSDMLSVDAPPQEEV